MIKNVWRIFPSASSSPSPLTLSIRSNQHERAHLEQPLGQSMWWKDKSVLHICWKWGYPSCRLSIPASKPGQDCTSNKVQLWFHMNRLGGARLSPISRLWSEVDSDVLDLHRSYSFHPEWIPKSLTAIQYTYLNIFGWLYTVKCFPSATV